MNANYAVKTVGVFASAVFLLGASNFCLADWIIGGGAKASYVIFSEVENGQTFNQERGQITTTDLFVQNYWSEHFATRLSGGFGSGTLNYEGETQIGLLFTTESEYSTNHLEASLEWDFDKIDVSLGLGRSYVERNIISTTFISGLYEETTHFYPFLGLSVSLFKNSFFQCAFQIRTEYFTKSDLLVEFAGRYDQAEATLASGYAFYGALPLSLGSASSWHVTLVPAYGYASIDKSESVKLFQNQQDTGFTFYQPQLEREYFSLNLSLSKRF